MNNSIAFSIGIDRSDRHLDFTVLDANGVVLDHERVGSDPSALHPWFEALRGKCPEGCSVAVAFQATRPQSQGVGGGKRFYARGLSVKYVNADKD